ncbi:putative GP46-like surface antigen [Leptomonas pyrrhocoris]|uniref:Putative GP46-like surface antigen n=1 Tax=Leptomonas pyrrhocoris TaxID=157538 RepID=A0A0N0DX75_LEPPY|nr:putative GP46-like surface antigen [Leptomonas pyrrhocoris]KPA82631.1 putative GP46-like surface antigen [Leptomonas pyrrhocoris]|eukprot:XP_015661070.1 putative GP46-like surface antigen [Leptomonas pyrrhocoris]
MLFRRCFSSVAANAFALCVVLVSELLLCAPLAQAGTSDSTLAFLADFREQIPQLGVLWTTPLSSFCFWRFITCNTTTGMASLELSELNLTGQYPQVNQLNGSLIYVESINISFNPHFAAGLRRDWRRLSHLRVLDLSGTHTDGSLPDDWGDLHNLEFLNLSNTKVGGDIPDEWRGMTKLVVLDLRNTQVGKMSVNTLGGDMGGLEVLQLGETGAKQVLEQLSSPSYFPRLRVLNVSCPGDTDTQELPSDLAVWASGLQNLEYVGFEGCGFTGCVPDSFRAVPVLMQAARRANVGLVMSKPKCRAYTCTSPTKLNDDTEVFLHILKSSHFMQHAVSLWRGDDYCNWPGVSCPMACGLGISVDLSALPLSGTIPDAFAAVGDSSVLIDSFIMRGNSGVVGTLPSSLAAALSLARRVELSSLAIVGVLPRILGSSLRYVEYFTITHTRICGPLPAWNATFYPPLRYADLSNNRMGGALSKSWAALPLETLDLRNNNFCGCVPNSWRGKPVLLRALDSAVLSAGTADACAFLNGCGNLNQQCDATADGPAATDTAEFLKTLRDSFPAPLSSWDASADYCDGTWKGISCARSVYGVNELSIQLPGAQLVGTLPQLPANIVGSRVLVASISMSNNRGLTGSLPVSWGRLSYLRTLDLSGCALRGDLPETWEGMSSLETLLIAGSRLCRGLPNWRAANMPNLKYFDASANSMLGGLSDSFGGFGSQLKFFNVTKNKFCGCIPSSWKPYNVLVAGVDNDAATAQCGQASNACGRYAMRCTLLHDNFLNFMDVNWNYLDLMKRHLSVDLDAATSSQAIKVFATWSDYEFCSYAGVSCRFHNGSNGFALDLKGVGLKGSLPSLSSAFRGGVAARTIDLSDNPWITGTLPPSWGMLTNLLYLDLSNTSVQSAIPTSWQGMHNLRHLSVAQTLVCGSLPPWSANMLVSVRSMNFSHSKLAGALSEEWGSFGSSGLTTLSLEGNAGLCACAPSRWLEGHVLPEALLSAFGTIPRASNTCASVCSWPPSCADPERVDSGNDTPGLHGVLSVHVLVLLVATLPL